MYQRPLCYHPVGEAGMLKRTRIARRVVKLRRKLAMLRRRERSGKDAQVFRWMPLIGRLRQQT
jgi:hypothetical protein